MEDSKRSFMKRSAATFAVVGLTPFAHAVTAPKERVSNSALTSLTAGISPITITEHEGRVKKAQALLNKNNINAIVIEPGASMTYFSGIKWWRSERLTSLVIPRVGDAFIVTPYFEEDSIKESLKIKASITTWHEHESPFEKVAENLKKLALDKGDIGFEKTVRYFVLNGMLNILPNIKHINGDIITNQCRMFKSQNELKLMHKANEITLMAYKYVYENIELGMTSSNIKGLMTKAQSELGGTGIWGLALVDESSALPHGSDTVYSVKNGSTILMDCGCNVEGYQSDISRTFVFGSASKKQHEIWNNVRKGQDIAFKTAQLGIAATTVDDNVRAYYETIGFGPGYKTPGLSHRTGHGIGMEGHEEINFVHGEQTKLRQGMCFSNEPGIYLPGKFGVRLEDCLYMTDNGPEWFTIPPDSLENPIGRIGRSIIG